jgi:hypothetical protein
MTVQELWDHLMDPLMFGTTTSTVLTSAMAGAVLERGGALVLEGALEGERV